MTDNRKVVPIAYCACCGARPTLGPLMGVYTTGAGAYCLRCEYAMTRPAQELTPQARAFADRLAARAHA